MIIDTKNNRTKPGGRRGGARSPRKTIGAALMHLALVTMTLGAVTVAVLVKVSGAAAGSPPTTGPGAQIPQNFREPDSYRARMSVNIFPTGNSPNVNIPPLQFHVARLGADRRWSFQMPQVGEVIYLDRAGKKHLVLPAQNRYVELDPQKLNIALPAIVTPQAIIDQLRRHAQFERIGETAINGRRAVKYESSGKAETHTRVGSVTADTVVYIGEKTGLPLRVEMNAKTATGAGVVIVIETQDIQTDPSPSLFEVPAGMNKVTTEELKQQVERFVAMMRALGEVLLQNVDR